MIVFLCSGTIAAERVPLRGPIAGGGRCCNAASVTDDVIPPYDSLPRLPGNGLRHAWDVCGRGDNLGTLNRLTGPVAAAASIPLVWRRSG